MYPKLPSISPSASPPPSSWQPPPNAPARPQEVYLPPQYPPASSQVDPPYLTALHQAPDPPHSPHPSEHPFSQGGYPLTHPPLQMAWPPQQAPPRSPGYSVGYPTPTPTPPYPASHTPVSAPQYHPYPPPQLPSQPYPPGLVPGQAVGPPLYSPGGPHYPPTSLGFPPPPTASGELQGGQGSTEQLQPPSGEPSPGLGPSPGPLDGSAAANVASADGSGTSDVSSVSTVGTSVSSKHRNSQMRSHTSLCRLMLWLMKVIICVVKQSVSRSCFM